MSRIIKFRAWAKSGIMRNWEDLLSLHIHTLFVMTQPELILMQSTGLKDINDKEIYEGDIVKNDLTPQEEYDSGNYLYGVIEFHDSGCFYEKYTHDSGQPRIYWEKIDSDSCVVIGNIYENPELLTIPTSMQE